MTKSEAIDKIKADYLIESQEINAMCITPWEKLALLASACGRAIAEANAVRASQSAGELIALADK